MEIITTDVTNKRRLKKIIFMSGSAKLAGASAALFASKIQADLSSQINSITADFDATSINLLCKKHPLHGSVKAINSSNKLNIYLKSIRIIKASNYFDTLNIVNSIIVVKQIQAKPHNFSIKLEILTRKLSEFYGPIVSYIKSTTRKICKHWLIQFHAVTIRNCLIQSGADTYSLSATGYGTSKLLASNVTAMGRSTNRRLEINIDKDRLQ